MENQNYTTDQVRKAVDKFTDGKFKKFGSIIDIAKFIWDVVNDIMDTFNDTNLSPQQKEDISVGISRCVVTELETKKLITKEMSEKMLNIINSADGVLDVLLKIYTVVSTNNIVNVLCGFFGFKCCTKVPETDKEIHIPKSIKIEVINTEVKTEEIEIPKVVTEIDTEVKMEEIEIPKVVTEIVNDSYVPSLEKIPE